MSGRDESLFAFRCWRYRFGFTVIFRDRLGVAVGPALPPHSWRDLLPVYVWRLIG